ncbi:MAG TPA: hypothetical protein VHC19_30265 [Pirellulales bacterium]|nr:hypothetical protein [Pirellulales bacterium]
MTAGGGLRRLVSKRPIVGLGLLLLPALVLVAPAATQRLPRAERAAADVGPRAVWIAALEFEPHDPASIDLTASVLAALSANGVAAPDHPLAVQGFQRLMHWLQQTPLEDCDARTVACALTALNANRTVGLGRASARRAVAALRAAQWSEDRASEEQQDWIGGTGRTAQGEPDLLHTALALQALLGAGVDPHDPYVQRAAAYITRRQLRESEGEKHSRRRMECGGFCETHSALNARPNAGATCAAVTALLAAGVKADDVRIQAAVGWLERHYTLDLHPGAAERTAGLYRYYFEFARAMTRLGKDQLVDGQGTSHDWRAELSERLIQQQRGDGSWRNPGESPYLSEGHSFIVTSYALRTLSQVLADLEDEPAPVVPRQPRRSLPVVRSVRTGPF